jgi:putative ABC transport system permease protein
VTIIGVVADAKQDSMDKAVLPEVYLPFPADVEPAVTFVVRGSADVDQIARKARDALRSVDASLTPTDVISMRELVSGSVQQERFRTALLSGFAVAALLLASIGIYGVLAYLVSQRTREIGIRMALGAPQAQVISMVFRQGMTPVAYGVATGVAGGFACARLIRTFLYGVDATNPGTYAAAAAVLLAVAMCACLVPARRASRVDPTLALRDE